MTQPRMFSTLKQRRRPYGYILPVMAVLSTAILITLRWIQDPVLSVHANIQQLNDTVAQLVSQSLIKGFSRPEEAGAITCPDTDGNGQPNPCLTADDGLAHGRLANTVRIGPGQLTLAPGWLSPTQRPYTQSVNPIFSSGLDIAQQPLTPMTPDSSNGPPTPPALRLAWGAYKPERTDTQTFNDASQSSLAGSTASLVAERVVSQSSQTTAVQTRLKTAFLAHLQQSAQHAGQRLSVDWAFAEQLHLSYEPDSSGTRFRPVASGCQCACTRQRCKCACLQSSRWESTGACFNAPDAGECSASPDVTGRAVSRCTATTGRYCYFTGDAWLSSRWAVSLYTPRASEGRACRPENHSLCPLTAKSGSTCTCLFDWPKPVSEDRLPHLRLQFSNGQARASWVSHH